MINTFSPRPRFRLRALVALLVSLASSHAASIPSVDAPGAGAKRFVVDSNGATPQPVVAIPNVLFPILTKFPDGSIGMVVFNQPSHGRLPADVDCWASEDEGRTWKRRGVAAPRDGPMTNRMSKSIGVAANGDLVVISGGWTLIEEKNSFGDLNVDWHLAPFVSRSADVGRTWVVDRKWSRNVHPTGSISTPMGRLCGQRTGHFG